MRLFWIAFWHRSWHSLFGGLFQSRAGLSAHLKSKTSRSSCQGVNQGHLGSTQCTQSLPPPPPPPPLAPLLIWRENVALALPACAMSPGFCPKHFGWVNTRWTLGAHLVHNWCSLGVQLCVHLVFTWCTLCLQLVQKWCTIGVHLVNSWCTFGEHLVCTFLEQVNSAGLALREKRWINDREGCVGAFWTFYFWREMKKHILTDDESISRNMIWCPIFWFSKI